MAPSALAAAFPTCCSQSGAAAPQKSHQGWSDIPGGKRRGHVPRDACVKPPCPSRVSFQAHLGEAHSPEAHPYFEDNLRVRSMHCILLGQMLTSLYLFIPLFLVHKPP